MSFSIEWAKQPKEFLKKIGKSDAKRIYNKIGAIIDNPMRYVGALTCINGHKLRVGDYRIIVEVKPNKKIINVVLIGHRKNIYKNLWK